jgi:hypothetical protein
MRTDFRLGSRRCENSLEPRTARIVFSIAFSQEKSPVQSVSTTTKLRQKFYEQVQRRSFHTAWVISERQRSASFRPLSNNGHSSADHHVCFVPTADITLNAPSVYLAAFSSASVMLLTGPQSSEIQRFKRREINDGQTGNPLRGRGRL